MRQGDDAVVDVAPGTVEAGENDTFVKNPDEPDAGSDVDEIEPVRQRFFHRIPCLGIIIGVAGCALITAHTLFVKLALHTSPVIVLFYSFSISAFVAIPLVICSNQHTAIAKFNWTQRALLSSRGIFGSATNGISNWGARYIPLGDASVIRFSAPVFVSIFGCIILKEQCGLFEGFSILLALSGVFLIVKPSFLFGGAGNTFDEEYQILGYCLSVVALFTASCCFIMIRKLKLIKVPYSLSILSNAVFGVLQSSIVLMALGQIPYVTYVQDMYFVVGAGLCNFSHQLFLTWALYLEEAGIISIVRTVGIVWAFIFEIIILKELPSLLTVFGAVLVIISVVIIGFRKWLQTSKNIRSKVEQNKVLSLLCNVPHNASSKDDSQLSED